MDKQRMLDVLRPDVKLGWARFVENDYYVDDGHVLRVGDVALRCAVGELAHAAGMSDAVLRAAMTPGTGDVQPVLAFVAKAYNTTSRRIRRIMDINDTAQGDIRVVRNAVEAM